MHGLNNNPRRGLSLLEVLIALGIMVIGIVSVIVLFPYGLTKVHRAVIDTRATLLTWSAQSTVEMLDLPNDPLMLYPPVDPWSENTAPAFPTAGNPVRRSVFNAIYGTNGQFETNSEFQSAGVGHPILIDPVLVNSDAFMLNHPAGTPTPVTIMNKRVAIRTDVTDVAGVLYDTYPPFDAITVGNGLFDLPIYSTWDAQMLSPALVSNVNSIVPNYGRRAEYIRHWFVSPDDLRFEASNIVIPNNPRRLSATVPQPWEYYQSSDTPGDAQLGVAGHAPATITRAPQFSWAVAVVGRTLEATADAAIFNPGEEWDVSQLRLMIFQNRNLAQPYALVRGCFFNRSLKATLSWPDTTPRPDLRVGRWIMEYTNTGGSRSDPAAPITHRHALNFHRIVGVEDAVFDTTNNQWLQVITLQNPIAEQGNEALPEYDLNTDGTPDSADMRPLPDPYNGQTYPAPFATTNQTQYWNVPRWVPVIIWDGLVEVFTGREVHNE